MDLRKVGLASIVGATLAVPFLPLGAQQAPDIDTPSFNDPEFWAILEEGPDNSDELRKVVTTYAASGMRDEVTDAFARYLMRSGGKSDPTCTYCQTLISAGHLADEDPLVAPLVDAMDAVVADAFLTRSPDALIRIALMTSFSSSREHRDRSLYFLTAATQLGIEDTERDEVVRILANDGLPDDALTIAEAIYEDPTSEHFHTEAIRQWIRYLTGEIDRRQQIGSVIVAAAVN